LDDAKGLSTKDIKQFIKTNNFDKNVKDQLDYEVKALEAIQEKCKDCEGPNCDFTNCPFYKYLHSKTYLDTKLCIKKYCKECLNGYSFDVICDTVTCPLYQHRKKFNF